MYLSLEEYGRINYTCFIAWYQITNLVFSWALENTLAVLKLGGADGSKHDCSKTEMGRKMMKFKTVCTRTDNGCWLLKAYVWVCWYLGMSVLREALGHELRICRILSMDLISCTLFSWILNDHAFMWRVNFWDSRIHLQLLLMKSLYICGT